MLRGGDRGRTGVSSFAGKRVSHSATPPRETALAVTRRKGTEEEAEIALLERADGSVVIALDDGEELIFDAQEFDRA